MTSPFTDLDRPPLRVDALRRALVVDGGFWQRLDVVESTGSTNADLVAAAWSGAAEGSVLVAEHQHRGRGRGDRTWTAPPRSGLTFSVLLRPPVEVRSSWGWLPLLAGVAVAETVQRLGQVAAVLKWPNDVLVGDRKVAGVLAEVAGDALVLGVGLNVSQRADELPVARSTSLAIAGSDVLDRDTLLRAVLRSLAERYASWVGAAGDSAAAGLMSTYRELCTTLGRAVTAQLPGGTRLSGRAADVDRSGHLVLDTSDGTATLGAGDVVHLR